MAAGKLKAFLLPYKKILKTLYHKVFRISLSSGREIRTLDTTGMNRML